MDNNEQVKKSFIDKIKEIYDQIGLNLSLSEEDENEISILLYNSYSFYKDIKYFHQKLFSQTSLKVEEKQFNLVCNQISNQIKEFRANILRSNLSQEEIEFIEDEKIIIQDFLFDLYQNFIFQLNKGQLDPQKIIDQFQPTFNQIESILEKFNPIIETIQTYQHQIEENYFKYEKLIKGVEKILKTCKFTQMGKQTTTQSDEAKKILINGLCQIEKIKLFFSASNQQKVKEELQNYLSQTQNIVWNLHFIINYLENESQQKINCKQLIIEQNNCAFLFQACNQILEYVNEKPILKKEDFIQQFLSNQQNQETQDIIFENLNKVLLNIVNDQAKQKNKEKDTQQCQAGQSNLITPIPQITISEQNNNFVKQEYEDQYNKINSKSLEINKQEQKSTKTIEQEYKKKIILDFITSKNQNTEISNGLLFMTENLITQYQNSKQQLDECLEKIKNFDKLKSIEKQNQLLIQLIYFKKELKNFNQLKQKFGGIDLLLLVEQMKMCQQNNKDINKKNCIMLFGTTGSGKSTLINCLLDCQPFEESIQTDNDTILKVISFRDPKTQVGHTSNSCTFLVRGQKIFIENKEFFILDTPGLKDNRGHEYDITNNLSISLAFQQSLTILPILIFNYHDLIGARSANFIATIQMFCNYINTNNEQNDMTQIIKKCIFVFTHATQADLQQIKSKISQIRIDLQDKEEISSDQHDKKRFEKMIKILQYIHDKMSDTKQKHKFVYEPLKDGQREEFLEQIKPNQFIKDCKQIFKTEINDDCNALLKLAIGKIKDFIVSNQFNRKLGQNEKDQASPHFYLNLLKDLSQYSGLEFIQDDYNFSKDKLIENLKQKHGEYIAKIKSQLFNKMNDMQFQKFFNYYITIQKNLNLLSQHYTKDNLSILSSEKFLNDVYQIIIDEFKNKMANIQNEKLQKNLLEDSIFNDNDHFNDAESLQQIDQQQNIENQNQEIKINLMKMIIDNVMIFIEISQQYTQYNQTYVQEEEKIQNQFQEDKLFVLEKQISYEEEINQNNNLNFKFYKLSETQQLEINRFLQKLIKLKDDIQNSFAKLIDEKFNQINKQIDALFNLKEFEKIQENSTVLSFSCRDLFDQLQLTKKYIKGPDQIKQQIIDDFQKRLLRSSEEFKIQLQNENFNCKNLKTQREIVKNLQKNDKFPKELEIIFINTFQSFNLVLQEYIQKLFSKINEDLKDQQGRGYLKELKLNLNIIIDLLKIDESLTTYFKQDYQKINGNIIKSIKEIKEKLKKIFVEYKLFFQEDLITTQHEKQFKQQIELLFKYLNNWENLQWLDQDEHLNLQKNKINIRLLKLIGNLKRIFENLYNIYVSNYIQFYEQDLAQQLNVQDAQSINASKEIIQRKLKDLLTQKNILNYFLTCIYKQNDKGIQQQSENTFSFLKYFEEWIKNEFDQDLFCVNQKTLIPEILIKENQTQVQLFNEDLTNFFQQPKHLINIIKSISIIDQNYDFFQYYKKFETQEELKVIILKEEIQPFDNFLFTFSLFKIQTIFTLNSNTQSINNFHSSCQKSISYYYQNILNLLNTQLSQILQQFIDNQIGQSIKVFIRNIKIILSDISKLQRSELHNLFMPQIKELQDKGHEVQTILGIKFETYRKQYKQKCDNSKAQLQIKENQFQFLEQTFNNLKDFITNMKFDDISPVGAAIDQQFQKMQEQLINERNLKGQELLQLKSFIANNDQEQKIEIQSGIKWIKNILFEQYQEIIIDSIEKLLIQYQHNILLINEKDQLMSIFAEFDLFKNKYSQILVEKDFKDNELYKISLGQFYEHYLLIFEEKLQKQEQTLIQLVIDLSLKKIKQIPESLNQIIYLTNQFCLFMSILEKSNKLQFFVNSLEQTIQLYFSFIRKQLDFIILLNFSQSNEDLTELIKNIQQEQNDLKLKIQDKNKKNEDNIKQIENFVEENFKNKKLELHQQCIEYKINQNKLKIANNLLQQRHELQKKQNNNEQLYEYIENMSSQINQFIQQIKEFIQKINQRFNNNEIQEMILVIGEKFVNNINNIVKEISNIDILEKIQKTQIQQKIQEDVLTDHQKLFLKKQVINQINNITDNNQKFVSQFESNLKNFQKNDLIVSTYNEIKNFLQKSKTTKVLIDQFIEKFQYFSNECIEIDEKDIQSKLNQIYSSKQISKGFFQFYSSLIQKCIFLNQIQQDLKKHGCKDISQKILTDFAQKTKINIEGDGNGNGEPLIEIFIILGVQNQLFNFSQSNSDYRKLVYDYTNDLQNKFVSYVDGQLGIINKDFANVDNNIKCLNLEKINVQYQLSKGKQQFIQILYNDDQNEIFNCLNNCQEIKNKYKQENIKKIVINNLLEEISNKFLEEIKQMEAVLQQQEYGKYIIVMIKIKNFSIKLFNVRDDIQKKINKTVDFEQLIQNHCSEYQNQKQYVLNIIKDGNLDNLIQNIEKKDEIEELNLKIKRIQQSYKYFNFQKIKDQGFTQICDVLDTCNQEIQESVENYFEETKHSTFDNNDDIEKVANYLVKIQILSDNFSSLKSMVKKELNEQISLSSNYQLEKLVKFIEYLGKSEVGQFIILNQKQFSIIVNMNFRKKTKTFDLEYTLTNFQSNQPEYFTKDIMKMRYQLYEESFNKIRKQYIGNLEGLSELIIQHFKDDNNKKKSWNIQIKDNIAGLVGEIFALWSLIESGGNENINVENEEQIEVEQPHYSQVLSIFLLLGLDSNDPSNNPFSEASSNNVLNEIKTGEGKSITLGITSIVLALLNYHVYVVSYSKYLSQRDLNSFLQLFQYLKLNDSVKELIKYGTFFDLCREMIDTEINIRENTIELLKNICNIKTEKQQKEKSQFFKKAVILVDEVDVFFTEDFFANVYTVVALLQDIIFEALIWDIWCKKDQYKQLNQIQVLETIQKDHKELFIKYKNIQSIIEFNILQMLDKLKEFHNHKYIVDANPETNKVQIAYVLNDTKNYQQTYGYFTTWAYAESFEKQLISEEIFKQNIGIQIKCGSFSYSQMISPEKFKIIQGVSGTLQKVNPYIKDILKKQFKINKEFYCPSMFGDTKLVWSESVNSHLFLEKNLYDQYFKIIQIIQERKLDKEKRTPVLIIFQNNKQIESFKNMCAQQQWLVDNQFLQTLTAQTNFEQKEKIIRNATKMNYITLIERQFGRGADFKCYDQQVVKDGGVTMIQIFLSKDINEEIQIKGRVARQGDKGYYYMVLNLEDEKLLELIGVEKQAIDLTDQEKLQHKQKLLQEKKDQGELYKFLDNQRNNYYRQELQKFQEKLEICKAKHRESEKYQFQLQQQQNQEAVQTVISWNSITQQILHFIIIIDDSGSMGGKKWKDAVLASENFISTIYSKFKSSFLTLMQFNNQATIKQEFEIISLQSSEKFKFQGGGTNFESPFSKCADLLTKYNDKCLKTFIIFYTDGDAPYPTTAQQRLQQLEKDHTQYLIKSIKANQFSIFIICENSQSVLNKMTSELKDCQILTSISPNQLGATFENIAESIEGQL